MALHGKLEITEPRLDKANDRFLVIATEHDYVLFIYIYSLTVCAHSALGYVLTYRHCFFMPRPFELLVNYQSV